MSDNSKEKPDEAVTPAIDARRKGSFCEDRRGCTTCYNLQKCNCHTYTSAAYTDQEKCCRKTFCRPQQTKIRRSRGFCSLLLRHRAPSISLKICLKFFCTWTFIIGPAIQFMFRTISICDCTPLGVPLLIGACRPGPTTNGALRLRHGIDIHPLQKGEFVPKVSEQTIGASGPSEGPIYRDSQRYRDNLKPNWNPDIIFRDEERTNEDRMMTDRCMDKLNILSVLVMNQWPGVFLRVTETWDDPEVERSHPVDSLHYEGRAVDITTSDQDRNKYPILARLAVEAEFDWVHYEKTHIHCSVKSPSSPANQYGGCFPGEALVPLPGGLTKRMDELRIGDEVWSMDGSGNIVRDKILTFIDIQRDLQSDTAKERMFASIITESGKSIQMTPNHLIFKEQNSNYFLNNNSTSNLNLPRSASPNLDKQVTSFAASVAAGEFLYDVQFSKSLFDATIRPAVVTNVKVVSSTSGAYAPLTRHGTIVVDGFVASCYAVVDSHKVAHAAMAPLRYYYVIRKWLNSWVLFSSLPPTNVTFHNETGTQMEPWNDNGVAFYAKMLYMFGSKVIPSDLFWGD